MKVSRCHLKTQFGLASWLSFLLEVNFYGLSTMLPVVQVPRGCFPSAVLQKRWLSAAGSSLAGVTAQLYQLVEMGPSNLARSHGPAVTLLSHAWLPLPHDLDLRGQQGG